MIRRSYGMELVINASHCNPKKFTRKALEQFLAKLCELIDMERALVPYFWDEENGGATDDPHLKGVSVMQFIETSTIVVHGLTALRAAFVNIFSCKAFDAQVARGFVKDFFEARHVEATVVRRTYIEDLRENSDGRHEPVAE